MRFSNYIKESINDVGIFKAIFMGGTPGAGKSYVISKISSGRIEPRIVNTDKFTEFIGNGYNVDWDVYGSKIETLTKKQFIHYINGVLPLWIDSTSNNPLTMSRRSRNFEKHWIWCWYDLSGNWFRGSNW